MTSKTMKNFLITLIIVLIPIRSFGLIEVDITRGNLNPLPIAVSPLSIDEESRKNFENIIKKKNIGSEISSIVENNLKVSGLFNPLNKDAFLQAPDIANLKPRFEDWNLIKAQALITGKVMILLECILERWVELSFSQEKVKLQLLKELKQEKM